MGVQCCGGLSRGQRGGDCWGEDEGRNGSLWVNDRGVVGVNGLRGVVGVNVLKGVVGVSVLRGVVGVNGLRGGAYLLMYFEQFTLYTVQCTVYMLQ